MFYNVKKTQLIVHSKTNYGLECAEEDYKRSNSIEMGPANSDNTRQLWLLEQQKGSSFELVNAITDNVLTEDDG